MSAMDLTSYEDMWTFWLDDACYQISRGVRYLGEPSQVSTQFWEKEIQPYVQRLQSEHGVLIRLKQYEGGGPVQVAAHQWVFDLFDALHDHPVLGDAVKGALLGYSSNAIAEFLAR